MPAMAYLAGVLALTAIVFNLSLVWVFPVIALLLAVDFVIES